MCRRVSLNIPCLRGTACEPRDQSASWLRGQARRQTGGTRVMWCCFVKDDSDEDDEADILRLIRMLQPGSSINGKVQPSPVSRCCLCMKRRSRQGTRRSKSSCWLGVNDMSSTFQPLTQLGLTVDPCSPGMMYTAHSLQGWAVPGHPPGFRSMHRMRVIIEVILCVLTWD